MNDNSSKVIDVDINEILPNRFQPRIQFDEDEILELSDSIKEHGVIQPLVVRTIGDKYEIIAGERRYKASVLAGKETVPVIIKNLNDKESAEIALIENIQRKNLTPIEEAISYKKILDMGYLTQSDLGVKLGKNQSSIANKIRLLNLSDDVQEALLDNKISERHARSLLRLKSLSEQNLMLKKILEERLTVRKTDEEIDKIKNKEEEKEVIKMNSEINPVINNSSQDAINFLGGNQPAQTIQMTPLGMPSGPILEPAATPSFAMEVPTMQPVAQEVPATPSFAMEVPETAPIIDETISNKDLEVSTNQNLLNVSEPIIVTDYNKQYDPLMANKNEFVNINKADFKEVINIIRECSSRIEKLGYKIELDEYDLTSLYQVEFKIEK